MAPTYSDAPDSDDPSDNGQWPADDIEGPDDDLDSGFDSMASDDDGDTDDGSDFGDGTDGYATALSDGSDVDKLSKRLASVNFTAAAPVDRTMAMAKPQNRGRQRMCAVCGIRPAYSQNGKNYPTCGTTCAAKYKPSGNSGGGGRGGNNPAKIVILCVVCGKKPAYNQGGKSYPTCGNTCAGIYKTGTSTRLCVICGVRPSYNKNGSSYPTCGLTCAGKHKIAMGGGHGSGGGHGTNRLCVICHRRPCYRRGSVVYLTCGMTCLDTLCSGGGDNTKCNYCHRRPKLQPHNQCGRMCRDRSRVACLMCRSRPKLGKYHFCGRTCKTLALKTTPRIMEIPQDHVTWKMVETKFNNAWKPPSNVTKPQIKHVYKIVESVTFTKPYDAYRKRVGNECFRYHGTTRLCQLGNAGQTTLCNSPTCAICNILKTSFNVALANPSGAAFSYSSNGTGVMILNKVVLGRVHNVTAFAEVTSLPSGCNSAT
ncbi:hypothetical protein POSPLADRAFT_1031690 [Postia placenta MAD-698-R-SB12]|uniref:PARP catalytic domain-containing protein n=1 Tax=Postia placenta MAD-698-R-SB12 TaxID=670580 RepID=A0A1X6N7M7_9APHY|nr:hypothetical protein POSPLADRAFT_1031690 [Postia placenta MAD-698-R-SB12]OSX64627.1 hypothetical protein POSPLADRAFT_1031690 [Postia placenta MAD-698-R-SB12]